MTSPRIIGPMRTAHIGSLSRPDYADNEIDLIELLSILVRRKFTIMVFCLIALSAGVGVSYLLPQRWTSTAELIMPQTTQLQGMEKILAALDALDIKTDISPDSLLSEFMRNFDAYTLREKYLVSTEYFKQLSKNKTNTPESRRRLIDSILQGNISSYSSSQDKGADQKEYRYYSVTFSAENPVVARDLLRGYINYVTSVVEHDVYQRICYLVEMRKNQITEKYNFEKAYAETAYRIKLERLQYALEIAKAAGLQKPSWSNGFSNQDDPDFPVTLGADGLDRKLKIVESLKVPTALNADLQNRHLYIEKINELNIDKLHFQPFKYMRTPMEPVHRDAPKRSLIVLLSALAGVIAGCGYVLLNSAMKQHRQTVDRRLS